MKDLIALVADKVIEQTLHALLSREKSLGIHHLDAEIYIHPHHDPGVFNEAGFFLAQFKDRFDYALVMFDRVGSGHEEINAYEIQSLVQKRLDDNSWKDRSGVIVLDPELEVWIWTDSPHVSKTLGVEYKYLKNILRKYSNNINSKPSEPKTLMKETLFRSGMPLSSSLYAKIARNVSFKYCKDPAFHQLRDYLIKWFRIEIKE